MDLRTITGSDAEERCEKRRGMIERELRIDLANARIDAGRLGHAEEKNCEQMWGHVPVPVGLAGPLAITFGSGEERSVYLPLATTEGALVASVNRGCKAVSAGVRTSSVLRGVSRSLAFMPSEGDIPGLIEAIGARSEEWKTVAEGTSEHLALLGFETDTSDAFVFLTIACDTDRAMGMNMVTVAAQAVGRWIEEHLDATFVTVAANVDSDKKPSVRTHQHGRGYEAAATAVIDAATLRDVLKTTAEDLERTYRAKIETGSRVAGAIGGNAHAANIIAALYLATGQDIAHTVEGSLADTTLVRTQESIEISIRLPAVLVGTIGGGTTLPAQQACLDLLLHEKTSLRDTEQLAQSVAAAVLAGELSLLAALSAHHLTDAHTRLAR